MPIGKTTEQLSDNTLRKESISENTIIESGQQSNDERTDAPIAVVVSLFSHSGTKKRLNAPSPGVTWGDDPFMEQTTNT